MPQSSCDWEAELESSPNHRVNFFLKRDGLAAYSHGEGRPSQEERERACPAAVSASQVFAHEVDYIRGKSGLELGLAKMRVEFLELGAHSTLLLRRTLAMLRFECT